LDVPRSIASFIPPPFCSHCGVSPPPVLSPGVFPYPSFCESFNSCCCPVNGAIFCQVELRKRDICLSTFLNLRPLTLRLLLVLAPFVVPCLFLLLSLSTVNIALRLLPPPYLYIMGLPLILLSPPLCPRTLERRPSFDNSFLFNPSHPFFECKFFGFFFFFFFFGRASLLRHLTPPPTVELFLMFLLKFYTGFTP